MASILEGARLVPWRWDLARSDFNRVSDLCTLIFVSLVVYLGATTDAPRVLTLDLPVVSPRGRFRWWRRRSTARRAGVDVRIFLWSQRKKADADGTPATHTLDLRYPYFVICILAASAANIRADRASTWARRADRGGALERAGAQRAPRGRGPASSSSWRRWAGWATWGYIARSAPSKRWRSSGWRSGCGATPIPSGAAPRLAPSGGSSSRTASSCGWSRVRRRQMPLLLREATYNVFAMPAWLAVDATWSPVLPEADGTTWRLGPGGPETRACHRVRARCGGGGACLRCRAAPSRSTASRWCAWSGTASGR